MSFQGLAQDARRLTGRPAGKGDDQLDVRLGVVARGALGLQRKQLEDLG